MVFAISNTLWMVLIYTLAEQGKLLSVFGSNPVGKSCQTLFFNAQAFSQNMNSFTFKIKCRFVEIHMEVKQSLKQTN